MADPPNHLRLRVTRGDHVESSHLVAVALTRGGVLERSLGDVHRPVFARSAAKPMQALPIILSGAADAFGLVDAEIAIACASHSGTKEHVRTVERMLAKGGLSADDLQCGIHPPYHRPSADETIREGRTYDVLQNNCSGKHTGMLLASKHLGFPLDSYRDPDHPLQERIRQLIARVTGCDPSEIHEAVDGCGVPVFALPLWRLAVAYERLANPDSAPPDLAEALHRIGRATARHPRIYGGPTRLASDITEAAGDRIFIKAGAEGVFAAGRKGAGQGMALKAEDGSSRAARAAAAPVLEAEGWFDGAEAEKIRAIAAPPIRNCHGDAVGVIDVENSPLWNGGVRP